jgi:hypothetical protein
MNPQRLLVLLLILPGCNSVLSSTDSSPTVAATSSTSSQCPEKPASTLASNHTQSVILSGTPTEVTGTASDTEHVGYTFKAKAQETFSYNISGSDLCVWIYTPSTKLFKGAKLNETGKYVVQIATRQGSKPFHLQMSLGDGSNLTASSTSNSEDRSRSSNTQIFSRSDFPKAICGDNKPSDPNAYPVTFYPVTLPNTEENLNKARSLFCADAFQKTFKDSEEKFVQIASFTSKERAESFANIVRSELREAAVGTSTTVYQ